MLFNSLGYLLLFLPIACFGYFLLHRHLGRTSAKLWLLLASLTFYGLWEVRFLSILLLSAVGNFAFARGITHAHARGKPGRARMVLVCALLANLLLLGVFKYLDFFLSNGNALFGTQMPLAHLPLPLGISFFSFTQIAFLVDSYRREAEPPSALNYGLFVSFFPHLLAGPILHHREMMPQFDDPARTRPHTGHIALGLQLIVLGLAKKVLIADPLARFANAGFANVGALNFVDSWITALSYTFQLYFDFSGYCDMALGAAWLLNLQMPINFAAPYRALDIQDFWRRWHITLGRFLRDYLYIPLGGNRFGLGRSLIALLLTFTLGGLWHGANWTYVCWGAMNGAALVLLRLWRLQPWHLPKPLAWALTFGFTVFAWSMFRAANVQEGFALMAQLSGVHGMDLQPKNPAWAWLGQPITRLGLYWNFALLLTLPAACAALALMLVRRDSNTYAGTPPTQLRAVLLATLFSVSLLHLQNPSEFIYFIF